MTRGVVDDEIVTPLTPAIPMSNARSEKLVLPVSVDATVAMNGATVESPLIWTLTVTLLLVLEV